MSSMHISEDILRYYSSGIEKDRLHKSVFQLEKERTQQLILRHLPKRPLKILDAGGGAGFYSFWLYDLGHLVNLLDVSPDNIYWADEYAKKNGKTLQSIQIGDARKLPFNNASVDVVLLMGPLYHLTDPEDRLQALREARRVLVKGGILISVGISRYASLLDGYLQNWIEDPIFSAIVRRDLHDGQHRNSGHTTQYFTTAYFHRPEEFKKEAADAGFAVEALYAVESFGWLIHDFQKKWNNALQRTLLLEMIQSTEQDPSMMGVTAHMLSVSVSL